MASQPLMHASSSLSSVIHNHFQDKEELVDENGNFKFPDVKISDLYPKKGIKAKMMNSVRQSEINLRVSIVGICPVYFPFLLPKDIKRWKETGFFHVNFSLVDIILHPHFNNDIGVEYLASLIDTRCRIWDQVVIGQFRGRLVKCFDEEKGGDACMSVRPNFTINLDDKYVQSAFCLLLQVKGIILQPNYVYAIVGGRCVYRLLNTIFPPSKFSARVSYTEANTNVDDFGRHIDSTGFDIGFPIIEKLINQSQPKFQELLTPSKNLFSEKPQTQSRRLASIDLQALPDETLFTQLEASTSGRPSMSTRSYSMS